MNGTSKLFSTELKFALFPNTIEQISLVRIGVYAIDLTQYIRDEPYASAASKSLTSAIYLASASSCDMPRTPFHACHLAFSYSPK